MDHANEDQPKETGRTNHASDDKATQDARSFVEEQPSASEPRPEGAAQLMKLFQPPTPPPPRPPPQKDTLLGAYSPNDNISHAPPPPQQQPAEVTTTPHDERTALLPESSSSQNDTKTNATGASSLQSLFQHPQPELPDRESSLNKVRSTASSSSFVESQSMFLAAKNQSQKHQDKDANVLPQADATRSSCWQSITSYVYKNVLPKPTTIAGSFMFLLYHVVFCLANGSAITRPSSPDIPILGNMAKWTAIGIFASCPVLIHRLGRDIPALYPSVDLFLAPFLAEAARVVDQSISQDFEATSGDDGQQQMTLQLWFGSFAVLTAIGMALAGSFLLLAATFKLANLGTFLPYSVLCGFFSAVGVLLWALAFSVDMSGQTWQQVFFSEATSAALVMKALAHHLPSLAVGILMNRLGPKNPFFVILLIVLTTCLFYVVMLITGTSLEEAQEAQWFWSYEELTTTSAGGNDEVHSNHTTTVSFELLPPTPFGAWASILDRFVSWKAVGRGLHNMVALAFLYLLRSSIHASALKKNVNNLVRRIPIKQQKSVHHSNGSARNAKSLLDILQEDEDEDLDNEKDCGSDEGSSLLANRNTASHSTAHYVKASGAYHQATSMVQSMRDQMEIISMSLADTQTLRNNRAQRRTVTFQPTTTIIPTDCDENIPGPLFSPIGTSNSGNTTEYHELRAKPSQRTLEEVFSEYGYALLVVSITGGFGCCPTVATSNTMYAIGAGDAAPQYGSVLLLLIFYLTDFEIVRFIPKTAFSSLLVLGAVDTIVIWFIGPFQKMESWIEWAVVPLIVIFSLFVGFLNAVFLGIGISTFIFVGSFFQVGVVKYNASALVVRSRIERSLIQSIWLDTNGDAIQIIVLQNYLFFGNASSILNYIATMFEEVDITTSQRLDFSIPPVPRILVVDLSLITGMDTSTVDIFGEIRELCKNNDCKLYLCGTSPRQKKAFTKAGIKPDTKGRRSQRQFVFFSDLDAGLGKAEDVLIEEEMTTGDILAYTPRIGFTKALSGYQIALRHIDELHGIEFSEGLLGLEQYTTSLELDSGQLLFEKDGIGGVVQEGNHGLFFIEDGMLRVQHDSSEVTLSRTHSYLGTSAMNKLELQGFNQNTLKGQHARLGTVARRSALAKRGMIGGQGKSSVRTARMGPGW